MTSCSRRTSTWSCSWATSTGALAGPRSEAATWPSWLRTSSVWWDPQALTCSAVTLLGRPVSIRAARRRMLRQVTSLRCPCAQVSEAVREVRGVGPDAVLRLGALCGAGAVAGGDGSGARHLRARHRAAPAGHARGAGACTAAFGGVSKLVSRAPCRFVYQVEAQALPCSRLECQNPTMSPHGKCSLHLCIICHASSVALDRHVANYKGGHTCAPR